MKEFASEFDSIDLLLVGGIQGSGKSTLTTRLLKDRVRANLDEIRYFHRRMTSGEDWKPSDWKREIEPLIVSLEERIIRFNLESGNPMVVDNTNITREARRHYIDICREMGRSIGILFIDLPLEECLGRNRSRRITVPEPVVRIFHDRCEVPTLEEGFDYVQVLSSPDEITSALSTAPEAVPAMADVIPDRLS